MTITPDEAFQILGDAVNNFNESILQQIQAEADELEALGWPLVRTADFRIKAGFFKDYLTGYYRTVSGAVEDLQVAKLQAALKAVSFAQASELP